MDEQKTPLEKGFLEPAEAEAMQGKHQKGVMGEAMNALDEMINGIATRSKDIKPRIENAKKRSAAINAAREELLAMLEASGPGEASPEMVEQFNHIKAEMLELEKEQAAIEAELAQTEEAYSGTEALFSEGMNTTIAALGENPIPLEEAFAKNEKTKAEWEAFKKSMGFPINEPMPWTELKAQHFLPVVNALLRIMLLLEDEKEVNKGEAQKGIATIFPLETIKLLDKVTGNAFGTNVLVGNTPVAVNVHSKNNKKAIRTHVKIDYDKLMEVMRRLGTDKGLTLYDREVYDAIATLYSAGNRAVTLQTVYKAMTGNKNARLTKAQEKLIDESITKFMYVPCYIDATEAAQAYGIKVDSRITDGPLLHARRETDILNGQETKTIKLMAMPALYEYANMVNQIGRWPVEALNTPVNKNSDTVVIQGLLMRRIRAMEGAPKLSRTITYLSIYNSLDKEKLTRKGKMNIRSHVKTMLADWVEKGEIAGFDELTKGDTSHGVSILLAEKEASAATSRGKNWVR